MAAPAPTPTEAAPKRRISWILIAVIVAAIVVVAGVAVYLVLPRGPRVATYAVTSEMVSLDPSTEFSNSILVLTNVYEALTFFDPVTQQPKPWLATSWSSADGGTTWTFNLRQGVKFHDGTPFNATAVQFSIGRTWRMGQGASFIWFPVDWSHPTPIEVVSEYVVRFHLAYPAPLDWIASAGYAAYIFSPKTPGADDAEMATWFNDQHHDSGSGPYTIDAAQYTTSRVVLNRFAGYWGGWGANQFDNAIIRVVADAAQREAAVRDGDADVTIDVPTADLPALRSNARVRVDTTPSYRTIYAFFNNNRTPMTDPLVRQALAYAIPWDDFLTGVVKDLGTQPVGVIPKGMWGHDDTLPKYDFNLTKADALLTQAGVSRPLTLNLTYTLGDPFERDFATLYKEKLATLSITLNIQPLVWEQQWGLAQGPPEDAQDIFVMYWWPTYITPYDFLWNMFSTGSFRIFNLGYYWNPTFDSTIDQASALEATDRAQALGLYRSAQMMLYDDAPGVGLVDLQNLIVSKSTLVGLKDNAAYPLCVFFYQLSR